jgi:hypothetical protein
MINYSIPKPHPLAGHFIKINSESEYNQMREIAEGCGFVVVKAPRSYHDVNSLFQNNMIVEWFSTDAMAGQEITLSELRELAELSKITLPCEMEVWDGGFVKHTRQVIDFYKGLPVTLTNDGCYYTWKNFRLPNHRAGEIKAKIKEHQEAIDKLNQELEGIK